MSRMLTKKEIKEIQENIPEFKVLGKNDYGQYCYDGFQEFFTYNMNLLNKVIKKEKYTLNNLRDVAYEFSVNFYSILKHNVRVCLKEIKELIIKTASLRTYEHIEMGEEIIGIDAQLMLKAGQDYNEDMDRYIEIKEELELRL